MRFGAVAQLAALEGGTHAYSFASGLAAEDTLLRAILQPGDHVLLGNDVYGGTFRLISRVLGGWGITVQVVDMSSLAAVRAAVAEKAPRVLWVETPSNPLRARPREAARGRRTAHGARGRSRG